MQDAQLPGLWESNLLSFTAGNTTQAKILCDVSPPVIQALAPGEVAVSGELLPRQRIMTGGRRVFDGGWTSTDPATKSARLWVAKQMSLFANMTTASISGTNAINRGTGSFITDGFQVGDSIMVFGSATAANNGVLGQLTAVTATVLTCNGAPFANVTEGAGFRVVKVSLRYQKPLAITAGTVDAVPPVPLLGGLQDPASAYLPDTGLVLDATSMLLASVFATLSALPARVDVSAHSALY